MKKPIGKTAKKIIRESNGLLTSPINAYAETLKKQEAKRRQIRGKKYINSTKYQKNNVKIVKPAPWLRHSDSKKNTHQKRKRKSIPGVLRHEVFKRDDYRCVECGATNKETTLHIDHIMPLSNGGTDELDNLQTLCETCNLAKSNRHWKGGE